MDNTKAIDTIVSALKEVKGDKEKFEQLGLILKPLLQALAGTLYVHRQMNRGFTPESIYEECIGVAGVAVSVQIVNEVIDSEGKRIGFALRKRDDTESGSEWAGLYHSTCTGARLTDTPKTALARDTAQAYDTPRSNETLEFLGLAIYDQPERWNSCFVAMHRRKVTREEVASFNGVWAIFTDEDILARDSRAIRHACYLLEWVMDENRPVFADVRDGWKPSEQF